MKLRLFIPSGTLSHIFIPHINYNQKRAGSHITSTILEYPYPNGHIMFRECPYFLQSRIYFRNIICQNGKTHNLNEILILQKYKTINSVIHCEYTLNDGYKRVSFLNIHLNSNNSDAIHKYNIHDPYIQNIILTIKNDIKY